jgi:very-short-patch-repair endonuclease
MTLPEKKLWLFLRCKRMLGYKFRRQIPFAPYIVDFVSHKLKLILELDGKQHNENYLYDQKRDRFLESRGYKVLRIRNEDIYKNLEATLESLAETIVKRVEELDKI